MRIDVAVDGGQSQVRVQVSGARTPVDSAGVGRFDPDPSAALIARVRAAIAQVAPEASVRRMVLGLTTLPGTVVHQRQLAARIGSTFHASEVFVCGDALTAHAGAFRGAAGVVLTVGTGIACLGFDPGTGEMQIVDGDGFLLGDAGGAFWMGSRGVGAVLQAADGRGAKSALTRSAERRFGRREDLAAHLHSQPRAVSLIAEFAQDVQEAAAWGDEVARAIVDDAAAQLARTAMAAACRIASAPVRIALTGRAIATGTILRQSVDLILGQQNELKRVEPAGDPLDGARWLLEAAPDNPRAATYLRHASEWREK